MKSLNMKFLSLLPLLVATVAWADESSKLGLQKGDPAPLFMAYRLDELAVGNDDISKAVKMREQFGKAPVALSFFTKECVVCKSEIKVLQELAQTYTAKGVRFYLVLVRTPAFSEPEIIDDVSKRKYTLPVLYHKFPETVFKKYLTGKDGAALGVPLLYLVDAKGAIAYAGSGFDTKDPQKATEALRAQLDALVAP